MSERPTAQQRRTILGMLVGLPTSDGGIVQRAGRERLVLTSRSRAVVPSRIAPACTHGAQGIICAALFALSNVKNGKDDSGWFRGTPVPQLLGDANGWRLYLYEAGYRATIYPRYWWHVAGYDNAGFPSALWQLFCAEWCTDAFLGQLDQRASASVEGLVP